MTESSRNLLILLSSHRLVDHHTIDFCYTLLSNFKFYTGESYADSLSPTCPPSQVVGGCGFVGFHVVCSLLQDPGCTSVSVLSRNPSRNCLSWGVSYYVGDITDPETVRSTLARIKLRVIIHAAAPAAFDPSSNATYFNKVNINGTKNLLAYASEAPSIIAFVYTSSSSVLASNEPVSADETWPVLKTWSKADPYAKSKAVTDTLVLEANDPEACKGAGLFTCCIRPLGVYGERDMQVIHEALDSLHKPGGTRVQIGSNTNPVDWCTVTNAASAHILAAKALVARAELPKELKVDGEAFFITDDNPVALWDFVRKIWAAAGDQTPKEKIWVIPDRVAINLATTMDWIYWIVFFGRKRPYIFTRQRVEYMCHTRTFRIDKAKERLGYVPRGDMDE